MNLTVVTASLHDRAELLAENMASVPPEVMHLVAVDNGAATPTRKYNQLVAAAATEWVAILDDDNYWLPNHLPTVASVLEDTTADVVYTYDAGGSRPRINCNDFATLAVCQYFAERGNFIDQSCLIRRSAFLEHDGFDPGAELAMDWDLWIRFASVGRQFLCIPEETWVYRMPEDRGEFPGVTL